MSEGHQPPVRFTLGRVFLWITIGCVWLAVFVDASTDSLHDSPGFSVALAICIGIALIAGPFLERLLRVNRIANRSEWILLWVGVAFAVTPMVYRVFVA